MKVPYISASGPQNSVNCIIHGGPKPQVFGGSGTGAFGGLAGVLCNFVHYLELHHVCGCAVSALHPHHHPDMNFYYISLLLLVVLSVYSESPDPPDPLDLTVVAVCPNSSSDSLGVLAPVLSQNEMSGSVLSQNRVLPQNEVYKTIVLPQSEVFGSQNVILPQNEVSKTVLLQNEAF